MATIPFLICNIIYDYSIAHFIWKVNTPTEVFLKKTGKIFFKKEKAPKKDAKNANIVCLNAGTGSRCLSCIATISLFFF